MLFRKKLVTQTSASGLAFLVFPDNFLQYKSHQSRTVLSFNTFSLKCFTALVTLCSLAYCLMVAFLQGRSVGISLFVSSLIQLLGQQFLPVQQQEQANRKEDTHIFRAETNMIFSARIV